MTPPDDRADSIIKAAVEMSDRAAREAFIGTACKDDLALEARVRRLLEAHEHANSVMDNARSSPEAEAEMARLKPEEAGERIGRYRLLEQIGEGGFGVVWVAEQSEPVRRRVALKIIKLGMDTKEFIARFGQERQALAMMDHPNIARVLDAGATQHGRPFFVMELVRGVKITEYCDQQGLSMKERLGLFVQVCQAVQHAHQKGIIHRDLKPSNILVTLNDGVPVPKVIDFGVAKVTQGRLTEHTVYTQFQQMVGTPRYMSPEQAEMTSLDIDTRSDIYSLGVLLYELLTGCTPIEEETLARVGLDEIRRVIREVDALRPSLRVKSLTGNDLTSTAKRRQIEAAKLPSALRGDLDWIVMKAIEKDRTRRYETANGLALDLQRYLNNEPILARPPSRLYRFRKTLRRNKLAFAASGMVLGALLVGLVIAMVSLRREKKAHEAVSASAKAAQSEAHKREQMAKFFQDMFARAEGRDTTKLKEIVNLTITRFTSELQSEPAVEAELRATLATIFYDLGDYAAAEAMDRKAIRLRELAGERNSKGAEVLLDHLGVVLMERNDLDVAESVLTDALNLTKELYGEVSVNYASPLIDLGLVRWRRGDLGEAERLTRTALQLERQFPSDRNAFAMALNNLGLVLWERGHFSDAEPFLVEANNLAKALFLANGQDVAFSSNNLALVIRDQGDLIGAERLFTEAIDLLPPGHPMRLRSAANLGGLFRRRAALSDDVLSFVEALNLHPIDAMTADALATAHASATLTPLVAPTSSQSPWRFVKAEPPPNWRLPDFDDTDWTDSATVPGRSTYAPVSPRIGRSVLFHNDLWLRREFTLPDTPTEQVFLRVNRCHDAEVFVNGTLVAPAVDWTDAAVIVPVTEAGRSAFKAGPNIVAVHCRDADGGTNVDVAFYVGNEASPGRRQVLDEFNKMIQAEPSRPELYAARASVHARLGHWKEAVEDLNQAVVQAPRQIEYWYQLAPLIIEANTSPGYNRHRMDALSRFTDPDGPIGAAQLAETILLQPLSGPELQVAGKLADRAGAAEWGDKGLVQRQFAKALGEYRQGRFASAIDWTNRVAASALKQDLIGWTHERSRNRAAAAYAVQAMAHHRQNQNGEAQKALAKAIGVLQTQCPQLDGGDLGREWAELLIAQILRHEAEALLAGATGK